MKFPDCILVALCWQAGQGSVILNILSKYSEGSYSVVFLVISDGTRF